MKRFVLAFALLASAHARAGAQTEWDPEAVCYGDASVALSTGDEDRDLGELRMTLTPAPGDDRTLTYRSQISIGTDYQVDINGALYRINDMVLHGNLVPRLNGYLTARRLLADGKKEVLGYHTDVTREFTQWTEKGGAVRAGLLLSLSFYTSEYLTARENNPRVEDGPTLIKAGALREGAIKSVSMRCNVKMRTAP